MDDAGPQSLFVVVSWITTAVPYSSSIIQLETPQVDNNHEYASSSANTPVFPTEYSAHFPRLSQAPRPIWLGMASSTEDLYMLLDWPHKQQSLKDDEKDGTLPGFIFNLSSKKCKLIKPPLAPKYMGHAVMLGDHVYFMAQPCYSVPNSPDPCFERYDTLSQKWEKLAHLPLYTGFIEGTAVLDDTILFYINSTTSPKALLAYNVGRNKWYPVNVLNNLCYSLVGVAVVLNQFIYGLVRESVVALTLKSQEKDGDLVFACDLHKEYKVPGMRQKIFERWRDSDHWTHYFVHLGKDNFCLIQSGNCIGVEFQYIQLTHIELTEKNTESIVTNIFVHGLKIPRGGLFMIRHCFFVPKCNTTTALKQGKGYLKFNPEQEAEIVVTLPPELDGYSSQTNIIYKQGGSVSQSSRSIDDADTKTPQVQEDVLKKSSASVVTGNQSLNDATKASTLGDGGESGRSHTGEKGHSIWVTNLPLDDNLELQLYKRLKRFGPIKNLACQIDPDNTNDFLAHVEFESATSKHKAIKASVIKVGGRKAVIKKKRGTGLTQASQTSQSRDDADTKTLQVQEDVPKKSSASLVTGHQSLNYATKASTLGVGHSICVTNLPPDANCWELFKGLMRFGPIKSFQFLIDPNNPCECCFADVEFERATSKQNAIKALPINIGGCLAVIKEKRGTGSLTQVNSKLKKRGKVSRSKKTS